MAWDRPDILRLCAGLGIETLGLVSYIVRKIGRALSATKPYLSIPKPGYVKSLENCMSRTTLFSCPLTENLKALLSGLGMARSRNSSAS